LIILLYSYRFVIFRLSISTVDPLSIDISVIQGSILGPILFLCYINDFWRATQLFTALFADDGTALGKGKNLNELTSFVNSELQKISVYCLSIYSCANMSSLNKLKVKQKEAVRIICNSGYRDHTAPLFERLN
jgi:hypothetical protein